MFVTSKRFRQEISNIASRLNEAFNGINTTRDELKGCRDNVNLILNQNNAIRADIAALVEGLKIGTIKKKQAKKKTRTTKTVKSKAAKKTHKKARSKK